jgi:hypothetical protein
MFDPIQGLDLEALKAFIHSPLKIHHSTFKEGFDFDQKPKRLLLCLSSS